MAGGWAGLGPAVDAGFGLWNPESTNQLFSPSSLRAVGRSGSLIASSALTFHTASSGALRLLQLFCSSSVPESTNQLFSPSSLDVPYPSLLPPFSDPPLSSLPFSKNVPLKSECPGACAGAVLVQHGWADGRHHVHRCSRPPPPSHPITSHPSRPPPPSVLTHPAVLTPAATIGAHTPSVLETWRSQCCRYGFRSDQPTAFPPRGLTVCLDGGGGGARRQAGRQ